jgi:flagellar biosynthesis protein FliP
MPTQPRFAPPPDGYFVGMKLLRTAAMAGVAKKVYDEARKPHNQQKIRDAVESAKARRSGGTKRT